MKTYIMLDSSDRQKKKEHILVAFGTTSRLVAELKRDATDRLPETDGIHFIEAAFARLASSRPARQKKKKEPSSTVPAVVVVVL